VIATARGERSLSTAIYFLLSAGTFSAWHRIQSDELWHFYCGSSAIEVLAIDAEGTLTRTLLGNPLRDAAAVCQHTVPAKTWFASRVVGDTGMALVGCTVAFGFSFLDFELAERDKLTALYPQHGAVIAELTRQ
jgi:predicted cupin superfamily sugar epimerase